MLSRLGAEATLATRTSEEPLHLTTENCEKETPAQRTIKHSIDRSRSHHAPRGPVRRGSQSKNRRSSQTPDLWQHTLDRRHAEKRKHEGGFPVPSICIPHRAAGGLYTSTLLVDGNKHLAVLVVWGVAAPRSRASPIGNTWHTPGSCTCHKSKQLGAEHHHSKSHSPSAAPTRTGPSAQCNRRFAAAHPRVASALPADAKSSYPLSSRWPTCLRCGHTSSHVAWPSSSVVQLKATRVVNSGSSASLL